MPQILLFVLILLFAFPNWASVQENAPSGDYSQYILSPEYFGMVRLNNYSQKAGVAPVIFDHWLHRAIFTCRICHVDIGFAMKSNETKISAAENMNGYYCGACHDGKKAIDDKKIFAACAVKYTSKEGKRCARCHSEGKTGQRKYDYQTFTKNLPRLQYNLIDWEKAEVKGQIKSITFIEGVSYARDSLKAQKDFSITAKSWRKSDVIFSHKKHVVWNGCGVCHPLIFPSSEKGTVQYSMFQIIDGEYCGACHVTVAFPVWICSKCHKETVKLR